MGVLDCEVGKAFFGVDGWLVCFWVDCQSSGWAGIDTAGAGAAGSHNVTGFTGWRWLTFCGSYFEIGNNFCEEDPAAEFFCDQTTVFADKAEAGLDSKSAFEDWAGVDVRKGLGDAAAGCEIFFNKFFNIFEPAREDFVIVAAVGIARDAAVIFLERGLVVIIIYR